MDGLSIERIRSATFSHSVRGYDRAEVEQFLGEIADWLQAGGGDDPTAELVKAELERIGEQTAGILTEAHDAAESIREDANVQARQHLVDVNVTSESVRNEADEYAESTREEADAYARQARAGADTYAEETRSAADTEAGETRTTAEREADETRGGAQREADKIVAKASRKRKDVESVISDLEERRDTVLAELERLASGLVGTASKARGDGEDPAAPTTSREPTKRFAEGEATEEHDSLADEQEPVGRSRKSH